MLRALKGLSVILVAGGAFGLYKVFSDGGWEAHSQLGPLSVALVLGGIVVGWLTSFFSNPTRERYRDDDYYDRRDERRRERRNRNRRERSKPRRSTSSRSSKPTRSTRSKPRRSR